MILECILALLSFTFCLHWTDYTHKLEKEDMKLKHTTKSWNWPYLTSYQIGPIINQFLYLHYSILCIFCVCSLSLSPYFFFFLQLLCTNMKKVAVQPSPEYKQAETKDSIQKNKPKKKEKRIIKSWWKKALTESLLAFRGEMSHASEISLPEANTHTRVVFVKFTR